METLPRLCSRCSQISFDVLSCPTAGDLYSARKALKVIAITGSSSPFGKGTHRMKTQSHKKLPWDLLANFKRLWGSAIYVRLSTTRLQEEETYQTLKAKN